MEYAVIDNFLDQKSFSDMQRILLGCDFPWYYSDIIDYEEDASDLNKLQFTHAFYKRSGWLSQSNAILCLLEKINPVCLIDAKANLQTRSSELFENTLHTDFGGSLNPQHISSVFYVNTCDGYTFFPNGVKVESVANRILFFNSSNLHAGTSVTNSKIRVVVNINFIQNLDQVWLPI